MLPPGENLRSPSFYNYLDTRYADTKARLLPKGENEFGTVAVAFNRTTEVLKELEAQPAIAAEET